MGTTNDERVMVGKALKADFAQLKLELRRRHGSEGYTGTLAEKDTVVEVPASLRGKRQTAADLLREIEQVACIDTPADQIKPLAERQRALLPYAMKWGDKWGPAIAIPLARKEASEAKRGTQWAGKRGVTVWLVAGMCSE